MDRLSARFPKGTSNADGVGKTRAKPVIRAKWGEFEAIIVYLKSLEPIRD